MYDPFFNSPACALAADTLVALCEDLMLEQIEQYANGNVTGELRGVTYELAWDAARQKAVLVGRYDPAELMVAA